MIFLDNNATTSVDLCVINAMLPYFQTLCANPSSIHTFGQSVFQKIQEVRLLIANRLGCLAHEIIFTGSGTEANNLCLKGFAYANQDKGRHLITSKIEHPSILETCAFLQKRGFSVTYLDVDNDGFVDPNQLRQNICKDTILISIGHVNNEIGVIQPLKALLEVADGIPFHTDVVQSFLKTDFSIQKYPVALASFSGHKFHTPKGIGFIYKKSSIRVEAQLHGGLQEDEMRAGTENVPFIIGMGAAIESYLGVENMKIMQDYLMKEMVSRFQIRINGPKNCETRVCSNVNFSFEEIEGEDILRQLAKKNIYVSTGSACSSKKSRISHVLKAIRCPANYIHGNIRIGLSKYTTKEEIDCFLETIAYILEKSACSALR